MRQLREWGWMHHLARHSVACFLTRGDLYISWEEGMAVFEELLIDAVSDTGAWLGAKRYHEQQELTSFGWMGQQALYCCSTVLQQYRMHTAQLFMPHT